MKFKSSIAVLAFPFYSYSQTINPVRLNQTGYYPNAPKIAIVTGNVSSNDFYITSTNLRDTVFTGQLSEEKKSAYSSTKTKVADFSALKKRGSFVVDIPHVGTSYIFEINENVHRKVGIATLKGYYYQRASMPLEEEYAGRWHRSAGHPDSVVYVHPSAATKLRPSGTIISSPGGWYDAGDYNKYIVNSGITMGTLLSAYEDFPEYFKQLKTHIPESDNEIPDILDEVVYNLRWMLTMQDSGDGGVYHKCTNASFDGMVMPGVTRSPRYVVQKGTAASLDFAAVTAQASRILTYFKKQFPRLADSCLAASKKAWQWSLVHPDIQYDQDKMNKIFKPEITTGAYGDKNFNDEWLWAATELFITTKEKRFFETVQAHLDDEISLPNWHEVGMMAYYSFLRFEKQLPSFATNTIKLMKNKLLQIADNYLNHVSASAFKTVMGQTVRDFSWGGNSDAANQGILLIRAYLISGGQKYVNGALSNLDYLLGRNATGYCFVTGAGSHPPMHPHHRPSVADGITEPVPGLLVGGPNPAMQDHCRYEFTEPETAYSDTDCAYASNEIAINWNAPMVYLSNAIEALQWKVGYSTKTN